MTPQSPPDVKSIFGRALELDDAGRRAAYLDAVCADAPAVRAEVEELLGLHARAGGFLRRPVGVAGELTGAYESPSPLVGTIIAGRYKLLEEIGDGGMGTVWMAEQKEPVKRLVAVKLIKAGMDSKAVLARFEAERQALAMMDHPNIAKVHDAGTDDSGRPYFVMELVKGLPLTEYCDARKLSVNDRLDLFVQICSAVQHAHQKAVIHRDLKPTNVLVTEHDGKPVPKVIDFGLAKALHGTNTLTDRTLHTAYGTVVGTPLYMAPEQVGINALDVDTRTDIYALGVILYELLTGTTPLEKARFKETAWEEMKRLIREEEPPKPSTRLSSSASLPSLAASRQVDPMQLRRLIRGELDWIVMKALDKDRSRRYETANGLSRDVLRYLKGEAVEACPPTLGYRLRKLYRRNRTAAFTAGAVAAALVAGLIATSFGFYRADLQRQRAEGAERSAVENAMRASDAAEVARQRLDEVNAAYRKLEAEQDARARADYVWSIMSANTASEQYRLGAARSFLSRAKPALRGWEWHYLNRLCQGDELFALRTKHESVLSSAFSPDGRWIATLDASTSTDTSTVEIWDVITRQPFTLFETTDNFRIIQFSSDSRKLLAIQTKKVSLWDIATRTEAVLFVPDEQTEFWSGGFSPDGRRVVTSGFPKARDDSSEYEVMAVWDVEKVERVWSQRRTREFRNRISWSQDGRWIVGVVKTGAPGIGEPNRWAIRFWNAETGEEVLELKDGQNYYAAALSPDGSRLVVSGIDTAARLWRIRRDGNRPVPDGNPILFRGQSGFVGTPAFSPDGSVIATRHDDHTVRTWDAATGEPLRIFAGHTQWISTIRFSPDGQKLLSTSSDGTARVWDARGTDPSVFLRKIGRALSIVLSPSGDRMLVKEDQRSWRVHDLLTGQPLPFTINCTMARFSPDGRRIAARRDSAPDRMGDLLGIYDADTGRMIREFKGKSAIGERFTFNGNGSRVMILSESRNITVWEIETDRTWQLGQPGKSGWLGAGYSPDGSRIFLERTGEDPLQQTGIALLDGETHQPLIELECRPLQHQFWFRAFSADGRRFLAYFNSRDQATNVCRIWDTTTGRLLREFNFGTERLYAIELSPDGSRIVKIDWDNRLLLLDADTGEELLVRTFPWLLAAAFDRTGQKLIVAGSNEVRVLDGTPLPERKN